MRRFVPAVITLLLIGAACGDDRATTTTSADATGGIDEATASSALLALDDLTGNFTESAWAPSDSPYPCDDQSGPGPDIALPPRLTVGVELDGTDLSVSIIEEIRSFTSPEEAATYLANARAGFGCATATFDSDTVTIDGPVDVTADTLSDDASAWTITGTGVQLIAIAAQWGSEMLLFTFASEPGLDVSSLDNPVDLVTLGVAKLIAVQ